MADYLTARAAIASRIAAVTIAAPVATVIAQVYETMGDGDSVEKFPAVIITGYAVRWERGNGQWIGTYTIGLRLVVRPISGASMRAQLDALKEAISLTFDGATKLGIAGNYHVVEGPNWNLTEPQSDGGSVWDQGEIIVRLSDARAFAA